MVNVDEDETLAAKAKKFNIELEVCALDESEEDIAKYEKNEAHDIYVLKSEFKEKFRYDYDEDKPVFDFVMSFADLEK